MSLFDIFAIGSSGLAAQNTRLNLTASNLANANSVAGTADAAYRARHPVFSAVLSSIQNGHQAAGVKTERIIESSQEPLKQYDPGHPLADAEGYIYTSNVNTAEEMTNMISATRSYQMNVELMMASKRLLLKSLEIGKA